MRHPQDLKRSSFLHTACNTQTWDLSLYIKCPGTSLFEHRSTLVKLDSDAAVSGPHGHQDENTRQQREWSCMMEAREQAVRRGVGPLPAQGKEDNNIVSRLWAKELASTRRYTAQLSSSIHDLRALTHVRHRQLTSFVPKLKRGTVQHSFSLQRTELIQGYDKVRIWDAPYPERQLYGVMDAAT